MIVPKMLPFQLSASLRELTQTPAAVCLYDLFEISSLKISSIIIFGKAPKIPATILSVRLSLIFLKSFTFIDLFLLVFHRVKKYI